MKRRATAIAVATAALALSGALLADAGAAPGAARQDTSGCIVLLPDAANPITICLFPR